MNTLVLVRRLWAHVVWADDLLWSAAAADDPARAAAWLEYAHVIGAEEVWLARLERRVAALPVWPQVTRDELARARAVLLAGYARFLETVSADALDAPVHYTNSAGQSFTTPTVDILVHVALHGQYHRGKINLMLRQLGAEPVPVDYIGFVRGAPAAITPPAIADALPGPPGTAPATGRGRR